MRLLALVALLASLKSECGGRGPRVCHGIESYTFAPHVIVEGYMMPVHLEYGRAVFTREPVPCETLGPDDAGPDSWERYRWRIEDSTIATFENGLVDAHRPGRTTIEASLPTGAVTGSGEVVVIRATPPFPLDASSPPAIDGSLDADR